jgi:hypothetical protein
VAGLGKIIDKARSDFVDAAHVIPRKPAASSLKRRSGLSFPAAFVAAGCP